MAQSSHSYVYSTVLQCASLDEWDVAASLLLLGAFLEMRYEFRPERVLAMKQQPIKAITSTASNSRNLLGNRCEFSSYANISSDKATGTSVHLASSTMTSANDGVALVHEAKLFIRAHLTNDDPISKPNNILAFVLHKLPEQWVDRAYLRIDRYFQKKPVELSSLVRVIMRNASSYEEESCYRVSSNWTVNMILGVFISQSGQGPKTFQFFLPSSNNKRDYTDYSFGSKSRRTQEIGSCTLGRLAEGKAEVVIYFDAILAPCLLV